MIADGGRVHRQHEAAIIVDLVRDAAPDAAGGRDDRHLSEGSRADDEGPLQRGGPRRRWRSGASASAALRDHAQEVGPRAREQPAQPATT